MGKGKNRGNHPSPKTIYMLIARAGGRCQFESCNKNVFLDEFTLDDTNESNIAHIVASSPDGPRGSVEESHSLSNKLDNLMLMCLQHHRLIDDPEQEQIYTVQRLREMKRRQEARVSQALNYLNAETTTLICLSAAIKGIQEPSLPDKYSVMKAIWPRRKPESDGIQYLGVPMFMDYESKENWECADKWLESSFETSIKAKLRVCPNAHFSVFPIAPIPLIIKLGYLFGDKIRAEVFQKTRHPDSWEWQSDQLTNSFDIERIDNPTGEGVAVVMSVTAEIEREAIMQVREFKTLYILRANRQGEDPSVCL